VHDSSPIDQPPALPPMTPLPITDPEIPELHCAMAAGRALDRGLDELSARWSKHWFTAIGEDGVVVGATFGLQPGDVVAPHWRGGMIAALIRGAPLDELVASCLGTAASYNRGRFRGDWSQPFEYGLLGAYSGNLGPDVAYGTGAAWAMQMQQRANVAVVLFGDGTAHRGEVHEAMNFAGLRRLPVVFVVQNNQFTICTPLHKQTACRTFADRAIGYGMPGLRLDGNDVLTMRAAMRAGARRRRPDADRRGHLSRAGRLRQAAAPRTVGRRNRRVAAQGSARPPRAGDAGRRRRHGRGAGAGSPRGRTGGRGSDRTRRTGRAGPAGGAGSGAGVRPGTLTGEPA